MSIVVELLYWHAKPAIMLERDGAFAPVTAMCCLDLYFLGWKRFQGNMGG
jgi:hypothetical protein